MGADNGVNVVAVGHGHQMINQIEEISSRTNTTLMLQRAPSQPRNYNGSDLSQTRWHVDAAWSPLPRLLITPCTSTSYAPGNESVQRLRSSQVFATTVHMDFYSLVHWESMDVERLTGVASHDVRVNAESNDNIIFNLQQQ